MRSPGSLRDSCCKHSLLSGLLQPECKSVWKLIPQVPAGPEARAEAARWAALFPGNQGCSLFSCYPASISSLFLQQQMSLRL